MTLFPTAKDDFTAENGVTYTWEDNRWRTKAYKLEDAALDDYLTKNNPRATGALTVSPVDWMEQSKFCVTNGTSGYFILKPSSTPERSQIQYWGMTEGDRDLATVGYVKGQLTVGGEEIDFGKFVKQEEFDSSQAAQDQLIAENARGIEELEVTKGPVSRYECKGTEFNVASRNGDLYVNSPNAADVTAISFAPFDLNGNPTRPVAVGDIIEFVEDAATRTQGEVSRYRVDSGDDPSALTVSYLNGANNFVVGEVEDVFIYPQNGETASKDYVDQNFLAKAGGTGTGNFDFDGDCLIRVNGDLVVKDKGQGIDGHNLLGVYQDSQRVQYWGNVDDTKCVTTKEYSDGKFLHKAGGTMTGGLECARPGTGNIYLFSCKAEGLPEGSQVAFRVTGDGAVKAGHNTSNPFMATAANDVVTKGYLDANGGGANSMVTNAANDVTTSFRIKNSNSTLISTSTAGKLKLYHVVDPTDAEHAANQRYVDSKASRAQTGPDTVPTLEPGEFYFCTVNKTLMIGT